MPPTTVDLLVRAVALMLIAWLAVTALRRQSASLRAAVWTLALAGLLLLPVLTPLTPSLRVGVWPAPSTLSASPAPDQVFTPTAVGVACDLIVHGVGRRQPARCRVQWHSSGIRGSHRVCDTGQERR